MMFRTMIIDDENADRCKALLNVKDVARRLIETPNWIIWKDEEVGIAWTLPHCVFRDLYTIVSHEEDCMIAERL